MRFLRITFGLLCYLIGFASIIYYFDFFTGFFVPKSINSGNPESFLNAVFVDIGLIVLFGLQHTLMARAGFKRWFEKRVPASLTRSFYILFTTVGLGLLVWLWQPIPLVIYDFRGTTTGTVLLGLYYLGWAIGLLSSFEIDHFKLFGVKQALYPDSLNNDPDLKAPFFYRVVRHPIYLGWILIHWMTPVLTIGHVILAVGITAYIYVALFFEERDLIREFGEDYKAYKKITPKVNPLLYPFKRSPKAMKMIRISVILGGLLFIGYGVSFFSWVSNEMAMMMSDDPLIWKNEITNLAEKNRSLKDDPSAVLFVGSSSFRFWDSIEEDLSPIKVINNGFGGAKLPDVLHYQEELIFDYNPKRIVFFLGSNDISGQPNDITPEELYGHYESLALTIHQKLPDCHIYILPITPTLARWDVWPQIKKANEIIRFHSRNADWVTFIDVEDAFLNEDEEPIWKYYKWDGTHLNNQGYQIWSHAIKKTLKDTRDEMITGRTNKNSPDNS